MWKCLLLSLLCLSAVWAQDACDSSNPPAEVSAAGAVIQTPGFGDVYPSNSLCEWVVRAPIVEDTVTLTFSTFVLEDCTDCACDYLEAYDGEDATAPLIGRFCGNHDNDRLTVSSVVYLRFVSDNSVNGPGFSAVVGFSDTACEGGMTITDENGWFTSPGYPANYPMSSNCLWRIRSTNPDMRVKLVINAFSLEPGCSPSGIYDYVTFTDSSDLTRMAYWYGTVDGGAFSYKSYSSDAVVAFHSDFSISNTGFNISYSLVPSSPSH